MVCWTRCALGTAVIGGTIATTMTCTKNEIFQRYRKTLNEEQTETLDRIVNYRMSLYIQGTVLGCILVAFIAFFMSTRMTPILTGCTFVVVVLCTQYMYYMLMPKPDWMLQHLRTLEQNREWVNVYRHMSLRWHLGLLAGLFGFFILGTGIRK